MDKKNKHHCVYNYLSSCKSKTIQIWTLTVVNENFDSGVTIEVYKNSINHVAGKFNRRVTKEEAFALEKLAKLEGFRLDYF